MVVCGFFVNSCLTFLFQEPGEKEQRLHAQQIIIHDIMGDDDHEVEEGMQTMGDPRAIKPDFETNRNGGMKNQAFEMERSTVGVKN